MKLFRASVLFFVTVTAVFGCTTPPKPYQSKLDPLALQQMQTQDFETSQKIQSSPEAIEKSVYEAISLSYRKANVNILEIRFNPMRRNREGLYDLDKVIFSAIVGLKKACMIYPVQAGLIIEMDRRFNQKQNQILQDLAR